VVVGLSIEVARRALRINGLTGTTYTSHWFYWKKCFCRIDFDRGRCYPFV